MTFGEKLRELRVNKGETQSHIAKLLKVTKATISKYENDQREVDFESIKILATHFKVSTDYLLGNETEQPERIINLIDELKDYESVAKMAKEANITPEQLLEQVKTLRKILGK